MESGGLGKLYGNGEIVVRQGEPGDCMYVIQEGRVEVIREKDGKEICLAILGKQEFFGEVPLFERERRSATVRVLGEARLLTVDRKTLMRRIQEDPLARLPSAPDALAPRPRSRRRDRPPDAGLPGSREGRLHPGAGRLGREEPPAHPRPEARPVQKFN